MSEVEHVVTANNILGEGPLWNPEEQALYWVDIQDYRVQRLYPATGKIEAFVTGVRVTALAFRASGELVTATARGFAFLDWQTKEFDFIADPEADKPHNRFNDGAVDHIGRFWAGTMNEQDFAVPDGCLYRLDPDGSVHEMETGLTVSNGLGWSPDKQTMYITDTFRRLFVVYLL